MWIWQNEHWPDFRYDLTEVTPILEETVRAVAPLALLSKELDLDKQLELESRVLLDEALATAKIEGEILDRESVRSSIVKRLGISKPTRLSKSSQAFIDLLLEAIRQSSSVLREKDLFKWHHMLFIEKPLLYNMVIGDYRHESMQVISGRFGKQTIHFEAPCYDRTCVSAEMSDFLDWLEHTPCPSGYIKAAIANFWFVTIHPFDDGNGRFSRLIAERCLAETEKTNIRLYSLSTAIEHDKIKYYDLLEQCQSGDMDITEWIVWFLYQVKLAAITSMKRLDKIRLSTLFWDNHRETLFNDRQRKLIIRLLETTDFEEGISRRKYKNLVKTSDPTATRDLKDLLDKKVAGSRYFCESLFWASQPKQAAKT
ncbi:cell filamentation protein Fic [Methylococcaceae bacterium HT2]|nr:cell filamentation protein Fic [Methylococcaceae bacterium HT2]